MSAWLDFRLYGSSSSEEFCSSTSIGIEKTGRANSIVLLFVPVPDGGNVAGYLVGYRLDKFVVNILCVAAHPRGFGDCGWQNWIKDYVAVLSCCFSIKLETRRTMRRGGGAAGRGQCDAPAIYPLL